MSWSIGQLATRNDVGVETIRFYERKGLLQQPRKPERGRRAYTAEHDRCLRFIRRAQRLGFSLDEIADLLELSIMPESAVAETRQRATKKLEEVRETIRRMQRVESALEQLTDACPGCGEPATCPIISAFVDDDSPVDDLERDSA